MGDLVFERIRSAEALLSKLVYVHIRIISWIIIIIYSMSFILEKVSSSDQLLGSHHSLQSNTDFFSFRKLSFQNARELSLFQSKSIIFKFFCSFCHLFLVICVFLLANFEEKEEQQILHAISSLFAFFSVIFYLFAEFNLQKLKDKTGTNQNQHFFHSTSIKILTSLFYTLHPNNVMNQLQIQLNQQYYNINQLLSILVCLRIFSLIQFFIQTSRFHGLRVVRLAELYAMKDRFSLFYALKCLYKQKGLKMPVFMFVAGLFVICFVDVNFQKALNLNPDFQLSVYDSVITMTTVGYGQIDHQNRFQRAKCIFITILGSFISSVLTLTILNYCEFSQKEMKAYITLKRLEIKQKNRQQNKYILRNCIKRRKGISFDEAKNSIEYHNKIRFYKGELSQHYWNDSIVDFYLKKNNAASLGIKKIVEKQLIIKTLMSFFISRRRIFQEQIIIEEVEGEEGSTPKSMNSNKSRSRKEDTKRIMQLWEKILADQQSAKRIRKQKHQTE